MIIQRIKGFTLIELLVVITIIGILATGATAVYTSQIQKARDTNRVSDIKALQWAIEQVYQDNAEYPSTDATSVNWKYLTWIVVYLPKLPKDPKSWELCNKGSAAASTWCDYLYSVADDTNGIKYWEYKVSTAFENAWNITNKGSKDWGIAAEDNRYEIWLNIADANKSTLCNRTAKMTIAAWISPISVTNCLVAIANAGWEWSLMVSWN